MTWADPGDLGVDVAERAVTRRERLVEPSEVVLLEEHGRCLPSTRHSMGGAECCAVASAILVG
jgi:hypothetical protein